METTFCKDSFYIEWAAESGIADIMKRLVDEFRKARGLLVQYLEIFIKLYVEVMSINVTP